MEAYRFQLSRAKGWRKPAGGVVCSRPGKWGNPWTVARYGALWEVKLVELVDAVESKLLFSDRDEAVDCAITLHRDALIAGDGEQSKELVARDLSGHPLGCWCSLSAPCHVDNYLAVLRGEL